MKMAHRERQSDLHHGSNQKADPRRDTYARGASPLLMDAQLAKRCAGKRSEQHTREADRDAEERAGSRAHGRARARTDVLGAERGRDKVHRVAERADHAD